MTNPEDSLVSQFSAENREQRAMWYIDILEEISGRQKPPSHGGTETFFLSMEVGPAFVNGCYIATVMLCAALVEQELNGALVAHDLIGADQKKALGWLVREAKSEGFLNENEFEEVDELRSNRVAFYHYREYSHEDAPLRAVFENQDDPFHPYGEYENRARHAIETWLKVGEKAWSDW